MGIFPLAAAAIAAVFCVALIRRSLLRRRGYLVLWAAAMGMYGIAAAALFVGAAFGWSEIAFRVFWLFGAVLTVPFLAAGEMVLLTHRRWVSVLVYGLLGVAAVIALWVVPTASIVAGAFGKDLPRGSEVFADAAAALMIARVYSYVGYAILVAGASWSAWKMRRAPELRPRFWGTLLIALGATVVAAGSAFAATGILIGFSVTLAVGIAVMFMGFVKAS